MRLGVMGGAGRIGLVTSLCLAEIGHDVVSMDVDSDKIIRLSQGILPFIEAGLEEMLSVNLRRERLTFTDEMSNFLDTTEAILICVGTPASHDGFPDMTGFWRAVEPLMQAIDAGTTVILRSTVPVGTNRELLEKWKKVSGQGVPDIVSCPEFLQEGMGKEGFLLPSRIVAGVRSARGLQVLRRVFAGIEAPWVVTSPENAEAIKYASNAFLAARISLVNEMANISEALGVDILEVTRGAGLDPRIGRRYLEAGVGYGGPCLEKDILSLIAQSEAKGYDPLLLKEVHNVNARQCGMAVRKLELLLGDLNGLTVGILGLSFKPGTDDTRSSPSLAIIEELACRGANPRVYDPVALVPTGVPALQFNDPYHMAEGASALVLLTAWPDFRQLDYERIRAIMKRPILVDGRNYLVDAGLKGFEYVGIGR